MADESHGGKVTAFVLLSCLVAASGGVLFGYDLGISGGVTSMDTFLKEFFPDVYTKMREDTKSSNYCKFNSQLLTAFTSSLYIAGLFASFLASAVTRSFGRKFSMIIGGALFFIGAVIGAAAVNVYMLLLGRILLGVGIGFTNQSIPLYTSEMAPPKYRGAIYNAFEIFLSLGILFANLINYGTQKIQASWNWRLSLALGVIPAAFLTIGCFFLPESPTSVLQQTGDLQRASEILQKIRGTANVKAELDDLTTAAAAAASLATEHPFSTIFKKEYRAQLVMAISLSFFQQLTGINVVNFYAPVMFRTIGFNESASLMSAVVTRVVATSVNAVEMVVVDRIGRRALMLAGGLTMFVSLLLVGGMLEAELKDHGAISKGVGYIVLVVVCSYVAGFAWSWGPLAWLIATESFPLEVRSAGQGMVVGVGFLTTFAIAQSFLAMLCHLRSAIFFFFAGWVAVMTLFVYLLVPETKCLPMEQIGRVWREHWYWKRTVGDERGEGSIYSKEDADQGECCRCNIHSN